VISGEIRTDATAEAVAKVFNEMGGLRDTPASPQELEIAKPALSRSCRRSTPSN
jgi:hypothetical protein